MSEAKFNAAKQHLAHSQAILDKIQPQQAQAPEAPQSQEMAPQGAGQTQPQQSSDSSKIILQTLKSIEQNVMDLSQRMDVLEQQSGQTQ